MVARSPRVRLDTPVNALLPPGVGLPGRRGGAVTLRHLLTHTSGLPRDAPARPLADGAAAVAAMDHAVAPANYSVDHLYALLGRQALPRLGLTARACGGGAPRIYSNCAVGLGSHAVGRAVGAPPYAAALRAAVLRPLGLAATTVGGPSAATDLAPAAAAPLADADGRPAPEHRMTDARAAAGGLRASVADVASWAAFCLDACRGGDGSATGVGGSDDAEASARRAQLAAALRSAWRPPPPPLPAWMPAAVRGVVGAVWAAACGPPAALGWFRVTPPGAVSGGGGSTLGRQPPTAWYSAGETPGFTTALYVEPAIGLAVLAAGNVGGSSAVFDLAAAVHELAAGGSPVLPRPPPPCRRATAAAAAAGTARPPTWLLSSAPTASPAWAPSVCAPAPAVPASPPSPPEATRCGLCRPAAAAAAGGRGAAGARTSTPAACGRLPPWARRPPLRGPRGAPTCSSSRRGGGCCGRRGWPMGGRGGAPCRPPPPPLEGCDASCLALGYL